MCGLILENSGLKRAILPPQVSIVLNWRLLTAEEKIMIFRFSKQDYH